MAEYIEREALLDALYAAGAKTTTRGLAILNQFPAADVVSVTEVNDTVDEAIRILNAINSSGSMDYGDYCELYDVISAIYPNCGADMREVDDED